MNPYAFLASVALLGSVGCAGTVTTGGSPGGSTTSSSASTSSGSSGTGGCPVTSTSNLPGVRFEINVSACTFSLASGVASIPYTTVIDHDIDSVTPTSQTTTCGTPAGSGLFQLEQVGGNGQSYCICDTGYPTGEVCSGAITLKQGNYPATFNWDFSNWDGPSDYFPPKGPPFPPGDYTFSVDAIGKQGSSNAPFEIQATLGIHVVP